MDEGARWITKKIDLQDGTLCWGLKCLHAGHWRRSFHLGLCLQKLPCSSRLGLATDTNG